MGEIDWEMLERKFETNEGFDFVREELGSLTRFVEDLKEM